MPRKRKSRTLAGRRIPFELEAKARSLQKQANAIGRKLSLMDAYRIIARRLP